MCSVRDTWAVENQKPVKYLEKQQKTCPEMDKEIPGLISKEREWTNPHKLWNPCYLSYGNIQFVLGYM